jgi:hypothetical protein
MLRLADFLSQEFVNSVALSSLVNQYVVPLLESDSGSLQVRIARMEQVCLLFLVVRFL